MELCLKNYWSAKDLTDDCFITDGNVSWKNCSCRILGFFCFSNVDGFVISDKTGQKCSSSRGILFSIELSFLVRSVSLRITDCSNNLLVFFLIGFFFYFGKHSQPKMKANTVIYSWFSLLYHWQEWRLVSFRNQVKLDENRLFSIEVQFHVYLKNVQVCFDYHDSMLQNKFAEVLVCILIDSLAVLLKLKDYLTNHLKKYCFLSFKRNEVSGIWFIAFAHCKVLEKSFFFWWNSQEMICDHLKLWWRF